MFRASGPLPLTSVSEREVCPIKMNMPSFLEGDTQPQGL